MDMILSQQDVQRNPGAEESRPIQPGKPGTKSRPVRIEQKRVRVIGMRLAIQHHWTGCTSPKRQGAKLVSQRLPAN
jgi:hypothetical protein